MDINTNTLSRDFSSLCYTPKETQRRPPLGERALLVFYHLRLLRWWPFLLMFQGFLVLSGLLWYLLHLNDPQAISTATALSRFVMESASGLFAGMLTSSLIMGDPLLEIAIATRSGLSNMLTWRALLTFSLLLLSSAVYLVWSLGNGIRYAHQQSPLFLLLMWLAPVLLMGMLGLLGSMLTRNTTLGLTFSILPLAVALLLNPFLLPHKSSHPFFLPYTSWEADNTDWWLNRLTLLGIALILAICNWWWLRREERLLRNAA